MSLPLFHINIPDPEFSIHDEMYGWAKDLFPICRSITGNGVRKTLQYFEKIVPYFSIKEIPSGTKCFDWVIPNEWNIDEAYIIAPDGKRVIDFSHSSLHVVSYSIPIDIELTLEELQEHLHSDESQPDAIPYVTSYYSHDWGFCLSHRQRLTLTKGLYRVVIKSTLQHGSMTYGEVILPGESSEEIFLSSYICHPSMANNELSGPVVIAALVRWLSSLERRRYTYRCILVPETIGAIAYLSKNLTYMRGNMKAGYVVSCVGDNREYSYLASRNGQTLADRAALHVMRNYLPEFKEYSYLDRGSDERQYCYPGVDLPVCSVMRSKYGTYPEYHSSLDDLDFISSEGLGGAFELYRRILTALELNVVFRSTTICEPRLGIRGLYPTVSRKEMSSSVENILNVLAYADGSNDLIAIADQIKIPYEQCVSILQSLHEAKLIKVNG